MKYRWICRCDCGNEVPVIQYNLLRGTTKSCGCLRREVTAALKRSHNATGSVEYEAWRSMLSRCYVRRNSGYANYGARGITVCARWRKSFANFLADMGRRPGPDFSLDRRNNTLGYSPRNCRWATRLQQNCNTRTVRLLTMDGETMPLHHWARRYGIHATTVSYRLSIGWSMKDALTLKPYGGYGRPR